MPTYSREWNYRELEPRQEIFRGEAPSGNICCGKIVFSNQREIGLHCGP